MNKFYVAFGVLCAVVSQLSAAPPIPGGPYKVSVGDVTEIEITEFKEGTLGFHNPYDVTELFMREATPRRQGTVSFIVQPKKAGIYRLSVWTQGEKTGATLIIDASGNSPSPPSPQPQPPTPNPPQPDPPRPTPPTPITSDHWFIVVEEDTERTPEVAQLLDFRKWDKLGVHYRFYDDDSPDAVRLGYPKLIQKFNLKEPALFVFDKTGNLISASELPKTFAEIERIRDGAVVPRGHSIGDIVPRPTCVDCPQPILKP